MERFFQGPIPFVLEESHIDKKDKKDFVLLVNLNAVRSIDKESTIKISFHIMKSGSVEDFLKWTNDMWYIVKNKPSLSPASKVDTVKFLLAEEALEEWETC